VPWSGRKARRLRTPAGWVGITARHIWDRGPLILILTFCCLFAGPVWVHPEGAEPNQALDRILTEGDTRAFLKATCIRLYWEGEGLRTMFKARWKTGPLDDRGYSYHTAELQLEETPPRIPASRSTWHEVTVLSKDS
jgi:hypothetical protein